MSILFVNQTIGVSGILKMLSPVVMIIELVLIWSAAIHLFSAVAAAQTWSTHFWCVSSNVTASPVWIVSATLRTLQPAVVPILPMHANLSHFYAMATAYIDEPSQIASLVVWFSSEWAFRGLLESDNPDISKMMSPKRKIPHMFDIVTESSSSALVIDRVFTIWY